MTKRSNLDFSAFDVVEAVDGTWIVLSSGFQWGAGPYDASGCSSQTWPTRTEAIAAVTESLS